DEPYCDNNGERWLTGRQWCAEHNVSGSWCVRWAKQVSKARPNEKAFRSFKIKNLWRCSRKGPQVVRVYKETDGLAILRGEESDHPARVGAYTDRDGRAAMKKKRAETAREWLAAELANGPKLFPAVRQAAQHRRISKNQLKSAEEMLKVKRRRPGWP